MLVRNLFIHYACTACFTLPINNFNSKFIDVDLAEVYIRILKSVNFSETNWLMIEMYGVAFDGCIDMQRWERAYQYGVMALKGYR